MEKSPATFGKNETTLEQARDTGLALVLILLLAGYLLRSHQLLLPAIIALVICMSCPRLFRPIAPFWFGLSHALGAVVSKLFLGALFYLLVCPVGQLRRMLGKDSMQLKRWRADAASAFKVRDHRFRKEDLENPY